MSAEHRFSAFSFKCEIIELEVFEFNGRNIELKVFEFNRRNIKGRKLGLYILYTNTPSRTLISLISVLLKLRKFTEILY